VRKLAALARFRIAAQALLTPAVELIDIGRIRCARFQMGELLLESIVEPQPGAIARSNSV
jgi:hypothetical protein